MGNCMLGSQCLHGNRSEPPLSQRSPQLPPPRRLPTLGPSQRLHGAVIPHNPRVRPLCPFLPPSTLPLYTSTPRRTRLYRRVNRLYGRAFRSLFRDPQYLYYASPVFGDVYQYDCFQHFGTRKEPGVGK
jgi:hypothetical protein